MEQKKKKKKQDLYLIPPIINISLIYLNSVPIVSVLPLFFYFYSSKIVGIISIF